MYLPPPDIASYSVATMSHVLALHSPLQPIPMSPEPTDTQKLIRTVLKSLRVSVSRIQQLDAVVHNLYLLRLHDNRSYVLKLPPPTPTRLLSHEQNGLQHESQILTLLATDSQLPVPHCIRCEPSPQTFGTPYLLRTHLPGTPLSKLTRSLPAGAKKKLDRSIGNYMRLINSTTASSFGPAHRVLAGAGAATWREAFLAMLECVLRDAEDLLVALPYESVRVQVAKHEDSLDPVAVPQLVPLEAGAPENVLVEGEALEVTGLLGLRDAVFGDPLVARAFDDASEEFWEGYGSCPYKSGEGRKRLLLAVVKIVTLSYRPQFDVDDLQARRDLNWALKELDGV